MKKMSITNQDGYKFSIDTDYGHHFLTDQPISDGGTDEGPTPVEYYVASLGGCIAVYAKNYLRRHGLADAKVDVAVAWEMVKSPRRIGKINVIIKAPEALDDSQRDAFLAVAKHCTVHNTIVQPPEIDIELT